jgi:putative GTP pyrophosphokinase
MNDTIEDAVKWYEETRARYEEFTRKLENTVLENLEAKNIDYYDIKSRTKTVDSFKSKLEKGIEYQAKEMKDLAGLRIIAYLLSDVEKICDCIKESFDLEHE